MQDWCEANAVLRQLGGPNTIVECDESKFFQKKYHRGRVRGQHGWVFGCVERGTDNVMMIQVERRDADTLIRLIIQWIRSGTRIITDGWRAYAGIGNLQELVNGALQVGWAKQVLLVHKAHFFVKNYM
jgi:hypothetical protein